MSCAFLLVRSRHGHADARRRIALARRYVPIVPETEWHHEMPNNIVCAAFSAAVESARGSYTHASEDGGFVVFNGWIAGAKPSASAPSSTIAEEIAQEVRDTSFDEFVSKATGEWALISTSDQGEIRAAMDFLGGEHIYYGVVDGVIAISNRAILCAAALHESIPAPNPWFLGWLLTRSQAFVSDDETPFSKILALHPRSTLIIPADSYTCQVRPRASHHKSALLSWDELAAELTERVRIIERLPNIPFRLSLTGGRDSRLVLAALVAAKCAQRLRGCYLIADPAHPDAVVGRMLADHYGLPFECMPRDATKVDLWNDLAMHNFQTEFGVHYWDSKAAASRPREGRIGGMYGEIYRSHAFYRQLLGWPGVAWVFEADFFVDPHDLMTTQGRRFYRNHLRGYWQRRRDEGLLPTQVRDRWHRDMRMWRWAGQTRLAVGLGAVNTNPLPSPRLLEKYLALSLANQRHGRVHFELMKKCAPWLAEQPFATEGFSFWLMGRRQQRLVFPPRTHPIQPQRLLWQTNRKEIQAYLLAPSNSEFFEIIDRRRLENRLCAMTTESSSNQINAVLGVLGVRHAIEEPIQPRPCRIDV